MTLRETTALSKWRRQWPLFVLVLPAVVYVFIFCYMTMYGVLIAFQDYRPSKGILGSAWVGMKHFVRFVQYPNFWMLMRNTIVLSAYSLATFPLPVILALLLNELDSLWFKKAVQMITYAPYFISTVIICSMLFLFMNRSTGLFNNILDALGGSRVAFLEEPACFAHIYVWSGVWQSIGWGTIIYIAALSGVSADQVEAAVLDGANRFQIICHINVPTIAPTIIIMLIMSCGSILSVGFEKVYLLQNSLNMSVSQVISTYVYEVGLRGSQFSYSTAIGLFNTVVNVLCILVVNAIAKRVSNISLW